MSEQPHSTQTAPIDEYRVLWTTQKKQKLKKWHDGFLRFHRFNKRMLVYDDARHLVADMYLRGRDAIGEGDDLEFEHHLVTIEEFKGTVVQDLTPLYSPAVQRKQQIQAGNALLNSPTPNQANRHGPYGPSRHATPTPQTVHQRRPLTVARPPPQTPAQRRPMGVPGLTLQQSARQSISYPAPAQARYSAPAQQLPHSIPTGIISRLDLPSPRQNLSPKSHPPPRQDPPSHSNRPSSSIRVPRQPQFTVQSDGWLPSQVPDSPNNRPNPPLSNPLQRPSPPSPKPNHAASHPRPPYILPGSHFATSLAEQPITARPSGVVSRPNPSRTNKRTPDVAFDNHGNSEFFVPTTPDLQSPPSSETPFSGLNMASSGSALRANKRSSAEGETRPFKPPIKRSFSGASVVNAPRASETVAASANQNNDTGSRSGGGNGGEPVESLINTGVLCLNNATSRKRNKLLCQPLKLPAAALKLPQNKLPPVKKNTVRSRTDSISISSPTAIAKDAMVIDDDNGTRDKPATTTLNSRKPNNTSLGSKGVGNAREGRGKDKGKGKASNPSPKEDNRIEEEEITLQYQEDNDVGPWSSEAFDLFDWRPPNMVGKK